VFLLRVCGAGQQFVGTLLHVAKSDSWLHCLSVRLSTRIDAVPAGSAVLQLCSADPKRSATSSQAILAHIYEMATWKCTYVCN